jgi:hypothetical protein
MDNDDRPIEPVYQPDMLSEEIYRIKPINRDSRQQKDKEFQKKLQKEEEEKKDDQDSTPDSNTHKSSLHQITDDVTLSKQAKQKLSPDQQNASDQKEKTDDESEPDHKQNSSDGPNHIHLQA